MRGNPAGARPGAARPDGDSDHSYQLREDPKSRPAAAGPPARRPPPAFYLANGSELSGSMTSGSSGDPAPPAAAALEIMS